MTLCVAWSGYFNLAFCCGSPYEHSFHLADIPDYASRLATAISSSDQRSISSICALNRKVAWVIVREGGSLGTSRSVILRTTNGGQSWERQIATDWGDGVTYPSDYLLDIEFIDSQTGWAVGSDGLIMKSSDGGKSWTTKRTATESALTHIRFLDRSHGWVLGDFGYDEAEILRTSNGGATWQHHRIKNNWWLNSLSFASRRNGWVVGERGQAYQTTDGGATWVSRGMELVKKFDNLKDLDVSFQTVKFINADVGFIVAHTDRGTDGISELTGIVFKTNDGGYTWKATVATKDLGVREAVFLNEAEAWLVPYDRREHKLLHTRDKGKTWEAVSTPSLSVIDRIAFVDSLHGWLTVVVSSVPFIEQLYHTSDGGRTWQRQLADK